MENTVSASEAFGLSLGELFRGSSGPEKGVDEIGGEDEVMNDRDSDIEETAKLEANAPQRVPMYRRLHNCIQAAASKVKDFTAKRCTKRVEILVNLIPKDFTSELDTERFYGVLVEHITRVLEQHVKVYPTENKWVVNEAMNAKSLHQGGTFRNVLSRKVDKVVVPIFSEIIAAIDQNCNLNLIDPKDEAAPLSRLWLRLFSDPSIVNFDYNDMITAKDQLIGLGGRRARADFKCNFPFSWLVYDAVRSQWDNAKSSAGYEGDDLHKHLCNAIENTAMGEVLSSVEEEDVESMYLLYLHDFVRFEHNCNHKDQNIVTREYQLISVALNALVRGDGYCSVDGHISLTYRIATLHVVYHKCTSEILWFGQLVAFSPGILNQLKDESVYDKDEMVLHLYAVELALKGLDPEQHLQKNNPAENLIPWLDEVHASQNAVSSTIDLPSQCEIRVDSRLKWEGIRALQLFLEHVLLKHSFEKGLSHLIRLNVRLGMNRDFLKVPALESVQGHLNRMYKDVRKELKKLGNAKEFKSNCQYYFIEVVSSLCFGGQRAPEPDLIKMLLNIIFTEGDMGTATREIVPLSDVKSDKIPVIRSSLLQLLLEHDDVSTEDYLEQYLNRSKKFFEAHRDDDLYLLCIQCFEDALYKKHCHCTLEDKIEIVIQILEKHRDYKSRVPNSVGFLTGVAGIRFAISEIASIHNFLFSTRGAERPQNIQLLVARLMQQAKDICVSPTSSKELLGPAIFLLKMIVRQFGFPCLKFVCEEYEWVIPVSLRTEDKGMAVDPFVIYNGDISYPNWRGTICDVMFGKDVDKLAAATQNMNIKEAAIFLLAMYEAITMATRRVHDDLLEKLDEFLRDLKAFSPPMLHAARCLLTNQQGGNLAQMKITETTSPEFKTLGAIVVHAVAALFSNSKLQLLLPFISMLENPASLMNAFLPTMVEGVNLEDFLTALKADGEDYGGRFVKCPKGHLYYIGNCGRANQAYKCNVCNADIGGKAYDKLYEGNQASTETETTQTGYSLGLPESRTSIPAPERSLSSPSMCIIRAIMHSAFLWCSCHDQDKLPELANLVKQNPANLSEFFWMHLSKDIEQLSRVTGKGIEESALIVHLVLQKFFADIPSDFNYVVNAKSLTTKEGRREWETAFNSHYIQPILDDLDQLLTDALDVIASDDQQGHSEMFYHIYEKTKVDTGSLEPHLWSYRQRISLEHIAQTLREKKIHETCPVLHQFLQLEPSLRATQYLPDIVKLQNSLYDICHHRLDYGVAKTQTIEEFLENIRNENARNEYRARIESFRKAWALVGHDLQKHAQIPLDDEHCLPAITMTTTIEYLIPTYTGAGAVTTCLVDYLIRTHNNFIKTCREIVTKRSQCSWTLLNVPITHIHRCHLLDYEHQIVSVILSHCCYSLRVGEAHNVHYDYQAIEKHILDKFIHGKPRILSDLPQVVYRKDIYTTVTLQAIRKNVSPQVKLDARARKEILSELCTADRLRESLDVIDIVIGFLSSGGVKAEKPLGEYIDKRLKMKKRLSQKLRQFCNLQHILSLWETLSVELAKLTLLQNQDPFDTLSDIKYTNELDQDQIAALDKCLRSFDLDRLLGALYEFMETFVKCCPDHQLAWPIKDVLETDQFMHLDIQEHFFVEFPDTINLDQTIAVWKYIVRYQKKWNGKS